MKFITTLPHNFDSKPKNNDSLIFVKSDVSNFFNYRNITYVCFVSSIGEPVGPDSQKLLNNFPEIKNELNDIIETFGSQSILKRMFVSVGSGFLFPTDNENNIIISIVKYLSESMLSSNNIKFSLHSIKELCKKNNVNTCIIPALDQPSTIWVANISEIITKTNNLWYADNLSPDIPNAYTTNHDYIYKYQTPQSCISEFMTTNTIKYFTSSSSSSSSDTDSDGEYIYPDNLT